MGALSVRRFSIHFILGEKQAKYFTPDRISFQGLQKFHGFPLPLPPSIDLRKVLRR